MMIQKMSLGLQVFDDQERSDRLKTVNSETVFQAVEKNPVSSFRRVSGELSIS